MEENRYLEAYYENERDANKQLSYACLFIAVFLSFVYVGYLTQLFHSSIVTRWVVGISFPILILILTGTFVATKLNRSNKPWFKYFLLVIFTLSIFALNILLPKHALLGWAICIILTNHYFNPKVGIIVFILSLVFLFLSMFISMFIGEFDPQLLTGELNSSESLIHHYSTSQTWPDNPKGRWDFLIYLKSIGINRLFEVIIYYLLPREITVVIIYFVSFALNKRTYKLFMSEIKVNSEHEKTSAELNIAKDIQLSTLPQPFASNEDIEILAELISAKEVGGDFYDYVRIDEEHIAILIGDVSGKGIPAAMFMMKTITCFKNFIRPGKKPSDILKEVNIAIHEGNDNAMFVTCFLAIINENTGEMIFSNAGHNPPVIGTNKNFGLLSVAPGFILGPMPHAFVVDETYMLKNDEIITLYTDGITEAKNPKAELYGVERLLKLYNSRSFNSVVALHHTLKDDVAVFVKDAPQADDMTFLTLHFHGDKTNYKEKEFNAVIEELPKALRFIEGFLKEEKIDESFINDLLTAGEELISNIINVGYNGAEGTVFIRLLSNKTKNEVILTLVDKGKEFNPVDVKEEDGSSNIHMVKKMMSSIAYDRFNGKNILTLVRKF